MGIKARSPRGRIDLSGLLWLALIGGGLYLGIAFVPAYVEQYEVRQVLREASNRALRENDASLKLFILEKCRQIGSHQEIVDGQERITPGVVVLVDDVFVNRQEKSIIVQVRYDKIVTLPLLGRQRVLHFSPSIKAPLEEVRW